MPKWLREKIINFVLSRPELFMEIRKRSSGYGPNDVFPTGPADKGHMDQYLQQARNNPRKWD